MNNENKEQEVVDFATTASEEEVTVQQEVPVPEKVVEMDQKQASEVLKLIDKNKVVGIEQMQRSVNGQEGRPILSGEGVENTVRTLEKGVQGALTSVEAINSLVDMLRHDLINTIENMQRMQQAVIVTNTQVGILMEVLKAKGMVTEEEMTEMFKKLSQNQQK